METACCREMHVCFTYCVVMARLDARPRREDASRSVNLFSEMFQVVDRIVAKSARFVSVILMLRSFALMHVVS